MLVRTPFGRSSSKFGACSPFDEISRNPTPQSTRSGLLANSYLSLPLSPSPSFLFSPTHQHLFRRRMDLGAGWVYEPIPLHLLLFRSWLGFRSVWPCAACSCPGPRLFRVHSVRTDRRPMANGGEEGIKRGTRWKRRRRRRRWEMGKEVKSREKKKKKKKEWVGRKKRNRRYGTARQGIVGCCRVWLTAAGSSSDTSSSIYK